MRRRLIFTYSIVIFLTIVFAFSAAAYFFSSSSADYHSQFTVDHSHTYLQGLEDYYSQNGTWKGVEAYFTSPDLSPVELVFMQQEQVALLSPDGEVLYAMDQQMAGTKIKPFFLAFASGIFSEGKLVGYVISGSLLHGLSPDFSNTLLRVLWRSFLQAAIVTMVAGLLLALIMASRLLDPIEATIKAAQRISDGDFKQRLPVQSYRDLSDLTTAVNDMAANLEKHDSQRSSLFADLAHDLRTPLAVQRASIEAVEDGIYPFNQETLKTLKQQNTHLVRLVEDLRLLAMLDEGMITPQFSPQDLSEFTRGVIKRFESMLTKQQRRVREVSMQKGVIVNIDPDRIEQILENLFQNAMRYTPEGSTIEIMILTKGLTAVLTVRDHGPGIPIDKLETIFDRYYQLNDNSGKKADGQGMGLAIALRLARVHGGNLFVRNRPDGGAEFTLELPLLLPEKPSRPSR